MPQVTQSAFRRFLQPFPTINNLLSTDLCGYIPSMKITQRSPVAVIILTIVTFGICGLYWIVSTKREINGLGASIPTSWLLIIPIANLYYLYKFAEGFSTYVGSVDILKKG
jgi:uncharacterized membrane protein (GlpM family)